MEQCQELQWLSQNNQDYERKCFLSGQKGQYMKASKARISTLETYSTKLVDFKRDILHWITRESSKLDDQPCFITNNLGLEVLTMVGLIVAQDSS